MGKRLWLATSLLVVMAVLVGGCTGHPKGMKSLRELTDSEKERVIEIALNTPEALKWREKQRYYDTSLDWVAMVWDGSEYEYSEWRWIDYEWEADENLKYVPEAAVFYPLVTIWFVSPRRWVILVRWVIQVAVDLETEKVVLVHEYPPKESPLLRPKYGESPLLRPSGN